MLPRRVLSAKAELAEPEEPDGDGTGFGVGELAKEDHTVAEEPVAETAEPEEPVAKSAVADPDWSWTRVKAELRTASEAMSCHLHPWATDPVVKRRRLTTVKRQQTPSPEYDPVVTRRQLTTVKRQRTPPTPSSRSGQLSSDSGVDHDSEIEQHFMEDPEEPMEQSMEAPMEDNYEHFLCCITSMQTLSQALLQPLQGNSMQTLRLHPLVYDMNSSMQTLRLHQPVSQLLQSLRHQALQVTWNLAI